uniref:Putative secreted protein n=1 Tax=Ixodes ricinus TaxID=34613 RepID=A0A147BDA9_IXORI
MWLLFLQCGPFFFFSLWRCFNPSTQTRTSSRSVCSPPSSLPPLPHPLSRWRAADEERAAALCLSLGPSSSPSVSPLPPAGKLPRRSGVGRRRSSCGAALQS